MFAGACHLFNNEDDDEEQVRELLLKSGHLTLQQQPDSPADVSKQRRVVLLGLPGAGKSSSGNTILGSDQFKSGCDFNSVSAETVSQSVIVEGCKVTVFDTPGVTNEVLTPEQLYEEIMKMIVTTSPGPHAFVIVVRIGRITNADIQLFDLLTKLFNSDALRYSMVLFTHGDELKDQSVEGLIQSNPHVSDLVSLCGGRYCVFDNRAKRRREQVRTFLNKVDEMVAANDGKHFTNDMFRMAVTFLREARNQNVDLKEVWKRLRPYLLIAAGVVVAVVAAVAAVVVLTGPTAPVVAAVGAGGGAAVETGAVVGAVAGVAVETGAVVGAVAGAAVETGAVVGAVAGAVGTGAVAVGTGAVAVGTGAGAVAVGTGAVAVGTGAGAVGTGAVAVGTGAGAVAVGTGAVAVGTGAVAVGTGAGAVAVGTGAGAVGTGAGAVAVGTGAGAVGTGAGAVAVGTGANAVAGAVAGACCQVYF